MVLPIKSSPELASAGIQNSRYCIETKSLSYTILAGNALQKTILNDVTCKALPGEVLAIVGPSGAGKSTLLSLLAGVNLPGTIYGEILVNGRDISHSSFRRMSGFVPQDDALFNTLTVEECLAYSARFRLGAPRREAMLRAGDLIAQLGLERISGSKIGMLGAGGISGGERKRVSIAVELVHNPAVLLLDEPTSGLDSSSARLIIEGLKSMAANKKKTVVLTLHQPGFRILDLLDRAVLISGGVVRHQGPLSLLEKRLQDSGHVIPPHTNVLEYAMDTIESLTSDKLFQCSSRSPNSNYSEITETKISHNANSRMTEVLILSERFSKNMVRNKQIFLVRMIQSALIGLLLGTIFMKANSQKARIGFFAFSLTFLLSSSIEDLPILLREKSILLSEVSRGAYRVSSYSISNALVFLPLFFAASFLYAAPTYWLIGLRKELTNFLFFTLVVWLVMLMGNAIVACFGALLPDFITGNSVIAGLMGSFFLFSGYFISKQSIPKYWIFVHYLSVFKYPFEAFLINEYGGEKRRTECVVNGVEGCILNGKMLLEKLGMDESHKWSYIAVLMAFISVYRILSSIILWIQCIKRRR